MSDASAAWKEFVDGAQTLQALVQRAASMRPEDRQCDLLVALNRLELACLELPYVSPDADGDEASAPNLDASWVDKVGEAFPEFGFYHKIRPAPVSEPEEALAGYAVDDLADILRDLDSALNEASARGINEGIWCAKFKYEWHFGSHLADLRSHVYRLRFFGP